MSYDEPGAGVVTGVWRDEDTVVVALAGEFDMSCADVVYTAGHEQLHPGLRSLTLDMTGVTLLDSTALSALIRLYRAASDAGVGVRLVLRHRLVVMVIELSGLDRFMPVTIAA